MGNAPSTPQPGTEFLVIGAGLSRTGTASFSEALRILLGGPVYHGGTQITLGPPSDIKTWMQVLSSRFPSSDAKTCDTSFTASRREKTYDLIRRRLDGYAAVTDAPCSGLVPELLEIYPNAKVICTVRDAESWERSMGGVTCAATQAFLKLVLLPLAGLRDFPDYVELLKRQWEVLYWPCFPPDRTTYHAHIEYLKRTVPEEKLLFFDVKEGWGPLCRALGREVPDCPFPRVNVGEALERVARGIVRKGLVAWGCILSAPVALRVSYWWLR